jgi:hypothetical protein
LFGGFDSLLDPAEIEFMRPGDKHFHHVGDGAVRKYLAKQRAEIFKASTGTWRSPHSDDAPIPKSSKNTPIPLCVRRDKTGRVSLGPAAATVSVICSCDRAGSAPVSRSAAQSPPGSGLLGRFPDSKLKVLK